MNYYERHIGDYVKDTAHLSLLEHGVYGRLLDVYYTREGSIPEREAARLIGARSKEEREALRTVLQEFFEPVGEAWVQHRCEREIGRFKDKQAKAKRSAEVRWGARPAQSDGNASADATGSPDAMRTHSEGNAPRARSQTPDTSNQTPDTRHEQPARGGASRRQAALNAFDLLPDVGRQVVEDWLKVRKAKRVGDVTQTAAKKLREEATKAGLSMQQALETCCERGWASLKAEWLEQRTTGTGRRPVLDAAEPWAGAQ